MRLIPEPNYKRDVNKILEHFRVGYKDLYNYLISALILDPNNPSIKEEIYILRRIEARLGELEKMIQGDIKESLTDSFINGQAYHLASIGAYASLSEAVKNIASSSFKVNKIEALISDTYDDLLFATQNTSRHLKKLVRDTVGKSIQYGALREDGRRTIGKIIEAELSSKGLSKSLKEQGFVGIIDKAGRKWQLSNYSDMVVRTKLVQAHTEGLRYEAQESGYDLAIISTHNADDSCGKYEGMIISLNGGTKGYPTYEQVKATGEIFHPNCRHIVHSFRDVEFLPKSVREKDEQARGYFENRN
jgi:hypothetical protein